MDKDYLKGLKIGVGILTIFGILFGIVYAVGFHTANEIISGTFLGNYIFTNNVTFNGVSDFTNSTVNGISGGTTTNDIIAMISGLNGGYINIENGFVDAFNDQSGIDNSSSINVSYYDSANNLYSSSITTVNNSLATGGTATSDSSGGGVGLTADKAFDNSSSTRWSSSNSIFPHWLKYDYGFGNSILVNKISITEYWDVSNSEIKTFTFDGSNDDITWSTLISGITSNGPDLYIEVFNFNNTISYRYYRLHLTDNYRSDLYGGVRELKFFRYGVIFNMTLISNSITATSIPTSSTLVINEEDVDVVTLNTDLMAYASRDNGTTWSQITLSNFSTSSSSTRILNGTIDLTSQPSGTLMRYKLMTNNSKSLKIHGVGMTWS